MFFSTRVEGGRNLIGPRHALKNHCHTICGQTWKKGLYLGQKKYPLAFKDLESGLFKLFMLAAARVKVASTASMPTGPIGEISIE